MPAEYDYATYQHQVPGGMISNLGHQLRQVGKEAQLQQALEETSRVRVEFGHPIMVTPLSQFVGSQAAINVILGERYKEVTDQVIRYALGQFGEEAVTAMDPEVRGRILDRPRAREIMAQTRPQPTLADMRRELGGARRVRRGAAAALAVEQGRHRRDARRRARPRNMSRRATRWCG